MIPYPENILPNKDRLLLSQDVFSDGKLIRFTSIHPFYDEEIGIYNSAIANPSFTHMPDLSCSLLSEKGFETEHIKLKILNAELLKYCNPNETVSKPIHNVDYEIDNNRFPYYFNIFEIHGLTVDYKIDNDTYTATCHVNHTPMKWNYWHFSVNWFIDSENEYWHKLPEGVKKKRWSKERLSHSTRNMIKSKAFI